MRATSCLGLLWLVGATAAPAQRLPAPLGRQVQLNFEQELSPSLKGELLAIDQDSVWLLQPHGVVSLPVSNLTEVRVQRAGMSGGSAMVWSLVVGAVSGAALTGACSSAEGATCAQIFPATMLFWTLIGAISASSVSHARFETVPSGEFEGVRPYARFPQGLPAGVARDSLRAPH